MIAQHTPGPWRIVIDGTCSGAWPHIVGPDFEGNDCDDAIAELGTCFVERRTTGMPGPYSEKPERFRKTRDHDQVMANARLIAAAPVQHEEMLRFLLVLERAEADPELWARLTEGTGIATANAYRAAIAEATGEKA